MAFMVALSTIVILSISLTFTKQNSTAISCLEKENIEALSFDALEWWNRNDYVCVPVTCICKIFIKYESEVAKSVDDGTGTVPHTWSCTGCGDCGYLVK